MYRNFKFITVYVSSLYCAHIKDAIPGTVKLLYSKSKPRAIRGNGVKLPGAHHTIFNNNIYFSYTTRREGDIMQSDSRMIYTTDDVSGAQSFMLAALCPPQRATYDDAVYSGVAEEIHAARKCMHKHNTHIHTHLSNHDVVCVSAGAAGRRRDHQNILNGEGGVSTMHTHTRHDDDDTTTTTGYHSVARTSATANARTDKVKRRFKKGNHVADAPLFYEIVFQMNAAKEAYSMVVSDRCTSPPPRKPHETHHLYNLFAHEMSFFLLHSSYLYLVLSLAVKHHLLEIRLYHYTRTRGHLGVPKTLAERHTPLLAYIFRGLPRSICIYTCKEIMRASVVDRKTVH